MSIVLPQTLQERIRYVAAYVADSTDDWLRVKVEIMKAFPPKERKRFSRRHHSTKKHTLNDFDLLVMKFWENEVGVELILSEENKHPEDWNPKPPGWGLVEINEQRKLLSKGTANGKKRKRRKKARRRKVARNVDRADC